MRRFYVFNDAKTVGEHCSQVKTIADLEQLLLDIRMADCNLTKVRHGLNCWAIDCYSEDEPQSWLFLAPGTVDDLSEDERAQFQAVTVLG